MELLFPTEGPLTSSQLASLLEAGLTFVLYHRGQIPLPYKQLQDSAKQQKKFEDETKGIGDALHLTENVDEPMLENQSKLIDNSTFQSSELMPRERISSIITERRKRLQMNRLERRRRQAIALESKAYNSIQSSLEILQRLLDDAIRKNLGITHTGHCKKIISTVLVLGPSLYCPKEAYYFELPPSWVSDASSLVSKNVADKFETSVLRQFYKKIITNSDLMDFTCKPLGKTYAHICLVSLGDLNSILYGNSYYKDVIRLPTLPPALQEIMSAQAQFPNTESLDMEETHRSPYGFPMHKKSKASKCFKIKIQHQQVGEESIESTYNSNQNDKSDSFSGDILFDNNSFSCYQIPLRFKGVQCKNKRL